MKIFISILFLAGICVSQEIQQVTQTNFINRVSYDAAGKRQVERVRIIRQETLPLTANNPAELEVFLNQLATNQVYAVADISIVGGTNSAPIYKIQVRTR